MFRHAIEMQAVSVDEALLEIEGAGQEENVATAIRNEIKDATGCEASIGIGSNILMARYINTFDACFAKMTTANTNQHRLSTKKAKPAGQYYCKESDVESLLSETNVTDLPGVSKPPSALINLHTY